MTDPFDDPTVTWRPVDPRLTAVRRLEWAIPTVLVVVLLLVLRVGVGVPVWLVAAPLALYGWLWWLVGRQVGAWGYAERAEELLVRRGRIWRRLAVIPYGRLQYVDVQDGPIVRSFGLASVQLHTASAHSDARIPGLPAAEAALLRDRLTARGQAQLSGL